MICPFCGIAQWVHGIAAPGLASRPYFNRYTEDAVDLCDLLSSFSYQGKAKLHELCRVMGLPGVTVASETLRNTVRATWSMRTGCGCGMSFFVGG